MKARVIAAAKVALTAFIGALAGGAIAPEHIQLVLKLLGI